MMILSQPSILIAEDKLPPKVELTKAQMIEKVYKYSRQYNKDPDRILKIINCENHGWNPELQSGLTYKKGNRWGFPEGTREKSWGLVQIHLPDHPNVTLEQATDAEYSIEFIAKNVGKVKWSCDK